MRTRITPNTSGLGPSKPMAPATEPASAAQPVLSAAPQRPTRNPYEDTTPRVPVAVDSPPPPPITELQTPVDTPTSSSMGPEWIRQVLPSRMVPYDVDAVWLRPLDIAVLSLLDAARRANSFTVLVDALNHCIDIDIRTLTPSDFYFVMYWIRDNSYPRRALTLRWVSQYGNENVTQVRLTRAHDAPISWREMTIDELELTAEDYAGYRSQGLCFPTVRDMEILKSGDVSEADLWRVEYAQYVQPTPPVDPARPWDNYVQRKLDALQALGLEGVSNIDAFTNVIGHGVREFLHVFDEHFEVNAALEKRRTTIENLMLAVNNLLTQDPENLYTPTLTALLTTIEDEKRKVDAAQAALDAGETVEPDEEVITIEIVVMDFFPEVLPAASV